MYTERKANQEPYPRIGPYLANDVERFWRNVHCGDEPEGCWIWTGDVDIRGRGRFTVPGRRAALPARVAYEMVQGPLPVGWHVTHTCREQQCVNPHHLRALTGAQRGAMLGRRRRVRS